jgi:hypothetical protein
MVTRRSVPAIAREQRRTFDRAREAEAGASDREVVNAAPLVALSELAAFPYCETRVDLDRRRDDIERTGPLAHDRGEHLVGESPGLDERQWERIAGPGSLAVTRQLFVLADEEGVPPVFLFGRPDAVAFVGSRPVTVLVVTGGEGTTLTAPAEFLAWLYCWVLDRLGFAVEGVTAGVVSTEPELARSTAVPLCRRVLRRASGPDLAGVTLSDVPARLHRFGYDPDDWTETLSNVLAYYRDERDPVSTRVAAKCRRCAFARVCRDSRV